MVCIEMLKSLRRDGGYLGWDLQDRHRSGSFAALNGPGFSPLVQVNMIKIGLKNTTPNSLLICVCVAGSINGSTKLPQLPSPRRRCPRLGLESQSNESERTFPTTLARYVNRYLARFHNVSTGVSYARFRKLLRSFIEPTRQLTPPPVQSTTSRKIRPRGRFGERFIAQRRS